MEQRQFQMKITISEDAHPELYQRLSKISNARVRGEMIRQWATMHLARASGIPLAVTDAQPQKGDHIGEHGGGSRIVTSPNHEIATTAPVRLDVDESGSVARGLGKFM